MSRRFLVFQKYLPICIIAGFAHHLLQKKDKARDAGICFFQITVIYLNIYLTANFTSTINCCSFVKERFIIVFTDINTSILQYHLIYYPTYMYIFFIQFLNHASMLIIKTLFLYFTFQNIVVSFHFFQNAPFNFPYNVNISYKV